MSLAEHNGQTMIAHETPRPVTPPIVLEHLDRAQTSDFARLEARDENDTQAKRRGITIVQEELSVLIQRASSLAIGASDMNRSLPNRQIHATIAPVQAQNTFPSNIR